jgi:GTP-binding protein
LKIRSSRFVRSSFGPADEPQDPGPDVVFLGRSNVGKSSLINRLLGAKGLARTSSQPGRTQSVNFYRVNDAFFFVDLPGYGYAKVPEAVRRSWRPLVEGFLERRRKRIAAALLVVDARREPTELDRVMRDWLETMGIPYLVAATKADTLSGNGRSKAMRSLKAGFGEAPLGGGPLLVSSRTGFGLREIWKRIDPALDRAADVGAGNRG